MNSNRFDYGRNINPTSVEILKVRRKASAFPGFFCITSSAVGLVIIYTFRCPGCSSVTSSSVVYTYWVATIVLFLLGVMLLALAVYYKRRQQSTTSRVAISSIPAEDLEKKPAQTLCLSAPATCPGLINASNIAGFARLIFCCSKY